MQEEGFLGAWGQRMLRHLLDVGATLRGPQWGRRGTAAEDQKKTVDAGELGYIDPRSGLYIQALFHLPGNYKQMLKPSCTVKADLQSREGLTFVSLEAADC